MDVEAPEQAFPVGMFCGTMGAMTFRVTTAQTGGEAPLSPGWAVIFGSVLVILGLIGVGSWRRERLGNGVYATAVALVGIAMILIRLSQIL